MHRLPSGKHKKPGTGIERYPKYRDAYIRAFDRMVKARTASGKSKGNWKDGESVFCWWMYGNEKQINRLQVRWS